MFVLSAQVPNVVFAEYLYRVLKHNRCTLPDEAMYMIRCFFFFHLWDVVAGAVIYVCIRIPLNCQNRLWNIPFARCRFHSFYPWHTGGAYTYLCDNKDQEMLPWIREFKWVCTNFCKFTLGWNPSVFDLKVDVCCLHLFQQVWSVLKGGQHSRQRSSPPVLPVSHWSVLPWQTRMVVRCQRCFSNKSWINWGLFCGFTCCLLCKFCKIWLPDDVLLFQCLLTFWRSWNKVSCMKRMDFCRTFRLQAVRACCR